MNVHYLTGPAERDEPCPSCGAPADWRFDRCICILCNGMHYYTTCCGAPDPCQPEPPEAA